MKHIAVCVYCPDSVLETFPWGNCRKVNAPSLSIILVHNAPPAFGDSACALRVLEVAYFVWDANDRKCIGDQVCSKLPVMVDEVSFIFQ